MNKPLPIANPSLQTMLQILRDNHIDVMPIIEAEIRELLPDFIGNIIENIYNLYNRSEE